MSFFLLGQSDDGTLHLLTSSSFETRHEAMAELSRLTVEPSFADWDHDVFVVDLGSAAPVLLVKPLAETGGAAPAEPITAGEPVLSGGEAAASASVEEAPGESAAVFEAPNEPLVEPVADEAIAQAVIAEAAEEPGTAEEELRSALLRTTAHMESTGIVAPESVAAGVESPVEPAMGPVVEPGVFEAINATEGVVAAEPLVAEMGEPAPTEGEVEGVAWPWDVTAPESEAVEAAPVATTPDDSIAFVLDALEEPSADDSSLLLGLQQDAAIESARPVILGAYDESPIDLEPAAPVGPAQTPEPTDVAMPADTVPAEAPAPAPITPPVAEPAEPMGVAEAPPAPEPAPEATLADAAAGAAPAESGSVPVRPETSDDISDFILDLGGVTSVPEAQPAEGSDGVEAGAPAESAPLGTPLGQSSEPEPEYTCEDCVYVETCPNQGQRLPKDCVSFQWK